MLTNQWGKVKIYCLNHKDEPKEMYVEQNTEKFKSPFYMCPDYSCGCPNRLNLDDYQGIVIKVLAELEKSFCQDITNLTFTYRGARQSIFVKVVKHTDDEIGIGISNKTVLGV